MSNNNDAKTPAVLHADEKFLLSAQVRARYGNVSDMWLWRRLSDTSGFPKPMILNRRRYWRLTELIAWETARANATPAKVA